MASDNAAIARLSLDAPALSPGLPDADAYEGSPIGAAPNPVRLLRALFLVHRLEDDPANGLSLRLRHLVAHLDRTRIEPHLLSVNPGSQDRHWLASAFVHASTCRLPANRQTLPVRLLQAAACSPRMLYHHYPALCDAVARHVRQLGADIVIEVGGRLLPSLQPRRLPVPLLCDLIDSPVLAQYRALAMPMPALQRLMAGQRLRAARAYERHVLARARAVMVASEVDARSLRDSGLARPIVTLTNGVDAEHYRPDPGPSPCPAGEFVVFEGGMTYGPNIDAATRFARDILPRLHRDRPDLRFRIVGRDPVESVRALACEHVIVTGTVDDVRLLIRTSRVFVCPMRLGAGIKNKILQAWSLGTPVVATSASVSGLDARDGEHLLLADDDESFAAAVARLLDDPGLAAAIAERARQHVVERFSWQERGKRLSDILAGHAQ